MGKESVSTLSGLGLSMLGMTCCALPVTLVALGLGGTVASIASAAPWLITLSKYKAWTFLFTALVIGFSWWQLRRVAACDIASAKRLRWQRTVLWGATGLFAVSVFAAYALLPIWLWLDR